MNVTHRAYCYNDEGQLDCICPIDRAEQQQVEEQMTRAEALRLENRGR